MVCPAQLLSAHRQRPQHGRCRRNCDTRLQRGATPGLHWIWAKERTQRQQYTSLGCTRGVGHQRHGRIFSPPQHQQHQHSSAAMEGDYRCSICECIRNSFLLPRDEGDTIRSVQGTQNPAAMCTYTCRAPDAVSISTAYATLSCHQTHAIFGVHDNWIWRVKT